MKTLYEYKGNRVYNFRLDTSISDDTQHVYTMKKTAYYNDKFLTWLSKRLEARYRKFMYNITSISVYEDGYNDITAVIEFYN